MNTILFTGLAIGFLCGAALAPSSAAAQAAAEQAPLQNTTSSLQPQAGATQQATNTQNQTGTLQNNNGSSVLNQTGNRPLGVVSSPNQTVPDAVAVPSTTLKTDVTKPSGSKLTPILFAVGSFAVALAGVYILRRKPLQSKPGAAISQPGEPRNEINPTSGAASYKPAIKPEPMPVRPLRKNKRSRRNKKKKK